MTNQLPQFLAESMQRFDDLFSIEILDKIKITLHEKDKRFIEQELTAAYHLGGQAKEKQFEDFIQTLIDKLREDANDERLNDFFRVNCREEINILKRLLSSLTKLKENEK